jgi:hypothetical protein
MHTDSKRRTRPLPLLVALGCALAGPPSHADLLDALKAAGETIARGVETGVRADLSGENIVIGTVEVISPMVGYATCFKDTPGAAISATRITSLTQARGFPSLILTRKGVSATGECAELIKHGLLELQPAGLAAGTASNAVLRGPCYAVPEEQRPAFARRCVSFVRDDPCSALPADGTFRDGQTSLAAACDARQARKVFEEVEAHDPARRPAAAAAPAGKAESLDDVQKRSAARFAEIQKQVDRDAAAARAQAAAAERGKGK